MVRRPRSSLVRYVLCVSIATALAACGGASEDERRADLADDLVRETDGALDAAAAQCVADGLFDAFGADSLDRVVAAAEGGDDPDGVRAEVVEVFTACDALGAVITRTPAEPSADGDG